MDSRWLLRGFLLTVVVLGVVIAFPILATDENSDSEPALPPGSEQYFFGDGTGVNCTLTLLPDRSFTFRWTGCLGEYGRNHGTYESSSDRVVLHAVEPNPKGFGGTPTEFFIVAWGERKYLVPAGEMLEFCNDVNAGTEPRSELHGSAYLRLGDEKKPSSGKPSVPADWRDFLLEKNISTYVFSSDGDGTFNIDAGSNSGLRKGMEMLAVDRDDDALFVEVVEVAEFTSKVRLKYGDNSLQIGDRLMTRWYGRDDCSEAETR